MFSDLQAVLKDTKSGATIAAQKLLRASVVRFRWDGCCRNQERSILQNEHNGSARPTIAVKAEVARRLERDPAEDQFDPHGGEAVGASSAWRLKVPSRPFLRKRVRQRLMTLLLVNRTAAMTVQERPSPRSTTI